MHPCSAHPVPPDDEWQHHLPKKENPYGALSWILT